ncbi:LacI family DNA-binding transcriptional regulator [Streptomyces radicis]|nr:LacI family DNA-binding transcriptional regulator [Streptomyces radicis]
MIEVAREAGVSAMTVSNVINGRPGVSAATRRRVLDAVAKLGYQVNLAARHLRAGRTGTVGLIVPDLDGVYYAQLADRLSRRMEGRGHHLALVHTAGRRERELEALSLGRLSMYDGVIMSLIQVEAADLEGPTFDTPVIFIGERPVPTTFDHVMMDNVGGALLATRHLLSTGSRRIAVIGGHHDDEVDNMPTLRTRGYRQAHAELGAEVDERLAVPLEAFTMEEGYRGLMRLHESGVPFDGAFALTDAAALGALRALADLGLRVPDDVQVIGFDNGKETGFLTPRLSSVEPGNDIMADTVMALLQERIRPDAADDGAAPRRHIMLPARLELRESTR